MQTNDFMTSNADGLLSAPVSLLEIRNGSAEVHNIRIAVRAGQIHSWENYSGTPQFYVSPGFVNCHWHWLMLGETSLERASQLIAEAPEQMIELATANAKAALKVGITACCDKGPPGEKNTDKIYQALFRHKNAPVLPRTRYSAWTGGRADSFASAYYGHLDSLKDLEAFIQRNHAAGGTVAKFIIESGFSSEEMCYCPVFPASWLKLARKITRENGMLLATHAKDTASIALALQHQADCIEHAVDATVVQLKQMQAMEVFVAPTLESLWLRLQYALAHHPPKIVEAAYDWAAVTNMVRNAASLNGEGAPFKNMLFASDGGSFGTPHASLQELYWLRKFGFSPAHVFAAATQNGARLLRLPEKIGWLRPGYAADMIFWRENPLALALDQWRNLDSYIAGVMFAGRMVE